MSAAYNIGQWQTAEDAVFGSACAVAESVVAGLRPDAEIDRGREQKLIRTQRGQGYRISSE